MEGSERERVQAWLVRLAEGDRTAFEPLFCALWPLLQRFCRRLVAHPEDAVDAAQQALLRVFHRASDFDPGRKALPWILGIAANECRTLGRRRRRRPEEPLEPEHLAELKDPGEPESRLVERDLAAAVAAVVGTLDPRDVETLRAMTGLGPRPRVPPATFRKRLQRALRRLRQAWRMEHES